MSKSNNSQKKPKPLSKEFLLSRGYCCNNGCINCPYYPRFTAGTTHKY
jgi:hypothetical protein